MPHRLAAWLPAAVLAAAAALPAPTASAEPDAIVLAPGAPLAIVAAPLAPGEQTTAEACTLTAIGYDNEQRLVGLTAGHCARVGKIVYSEDSSGVGMIGKIVKINHDMSHPAVADEAHPWVEDLDYAVIEFNEEKVIPSSQVRVGDRTIDVADVGGEPEVGDKVCKVGRTTGLTCGEVTEVKDWAHAATFCTKEGDSGGPVFLGDRIVGLVTTSVTIVGSNACGTETGSNIDTVLGAIGPGVGDGFQQFTE
ncbi:conserved hypothetical protein [Segniliparus rotundus DSM 44985]|uniref:Peptidase S1 domain-containing protein n=2 Tax=Segniliparus rotundus TaxID=286802 RepID=D6ZCR6_SEGRD|nr:conserved hypothetical protein [Segniliparus rotundus DSM 44985]